MKKKRYDVLYVTYIKSELLFIYIFFFYLFIHIIKLRFVDRFFVSVTLSCL